MPNEAASVSTSHSLSVESLMSRSARETVLIVPSSILLPDASLDGSVGTGRVTGILGFARASEHQQVVELRLRGTNGPAVNARGLHSRRRNVRRGDRAARRSF